MILPTESDATELLLACESANSYKRLLSGSSPASHRGSVTESCGPVLSKSVCRSLRGRPQRAARCGEDRPACERRCDHSCCQLSAEHSSADRTPALLQRGAGASRATTPRRP